MTLLTHQYALSLFGLLSASLLWTSGAFQPSFPRLPTRSSFPIDNHFGMKTRRLMTASVADWSPPSKDQSIGIIGGGPSGIAAAWFLMKKGYSDVTVLEGADEVGGKCLTVNYTDSKGITNNYELGAEYITYAYETLFEFMDEVGEKWVPAGGIEVILGGGKFIEALKYSPILKVLPAAIKYLFILIKYRNIISNPSNAGIAAIPFLSQSSDEFIEKEGLQALKPIFLVRQFGYGPFPQFPTINLLRTVPLPTLLRSLGEQIPVVKNFFKRPIAALAVDGTQGLFKKMAVSLNEKKAAAGQSVDAVLVGQKVTTMTRKNDKILVDTASGKQHTFDKVICAIPPDYVEKLFKFPEEESKLMKMIGYDPYFVACIDPDYNLERAYYQNLETLEDDPVQFSKRWTDSPIVAYGYNWKTAEKVLNKKNLEKLYCELSNYCKNNMNINSFSFLPNPALWETYHPNVPIEAYQDGYYDKLEAIQGKYGLYLTGDGMAAESMEYSCKYSKQLIDRFF
ncbi:hypothetical protein FisN_23Hh049 [Fistulifera solaris]|uniref:monoamine oxidase n=1 Tax=Fistulifera solaris TaxID=1519565 RepID=A0A1Z5KMZ0_FISSO|nr:hypothetical protein FisN_23Hh049 [Fistulifera solaris]|eukprot:GAX27485.1 hypothetical protein FisN_23Hh049 [Fistulifera solaris]